MERDREIHPDLRLFRKLKRTAVDASSLIIMDKAGFLNTLSREISLLTIPQIIRETGMEECAVERIEEEIPPDLAGSKRLTDRLLVRFAARRNLPVIAEDRKILLEAEREELPYFNAVMMLNFLLFKGRISPEEHSLYFHRLLEHARYSRNILAYSKEVFLEVLKGI